MSNTSVPRLHPMLNYFRARWFLVPDDPPMTKMEGAAQKFHIFSVQVRIFHVNSFSSAFDA